MVDPARPMLAEVLDALATECTGVSASWCPVHGDCLCRWCYANGRDFGSHSGCPLHGVGTHHSDECESVDDAQERLVSRGLLPEGWCGDVRRGWYFDETHRTGTGTAPGSPLWYGSQPLTIPDIVAVASLGWPAIQRAEELARAACAALREYGCPQPERVVWRVGARRLGYLIVPGRGSMHSPHHRAHESDAGPFALWLSGLALDAITDDAVRIVVPPVVGAR